MGHSAKTRKRSEISAVRGLFSPGYKQQRTGVYAEIPDMSGMAEMTVPFVTRPVPTVA